jgi:hypothetical protein
MFNHPPAYEPRASRIIIPGREDMLTELWMGGANSLHGDLIAPSDLFDAWVVDLAGDMPAEYRTACGHWLPRVFADVEQVPHGYQRLAALAASIAACLAGEVRDDGWPHPADPPRRLYVMCQQGLNRSGLLTGLILRALGVPPEDALRAIAARPGALTNLTYVRLVREWPDGFVEDQAAL